MLTHVPPVRRYTGLSNSVTRGATPSYGSGRHDGRTESTGDAR